MYGENRTLGSFGSDRNASRHVKPSRFLLYGENAILDFAPIGTLNVGTHLSHYNENCALAYEKCVKYVFIVDTSNFGYLVA